MAKLVGMTELREVPWLAPAVSVSSDAERLSLTTGEVPTGEEAKMLILSMGAVAGGIVLGAAAAGSFKHGWIEEVPEQPVPGMFEQLATFAAFNVGAVMFGDMLRQGMDEYGPKNVAFGALAFLGFVGVVTLVKG